MLKGCISVVAWTLLFSFAAHAQSAFEGIVKLQVTMMDADPGIFAENIDYSKEEVSRQLDSLYKIIPEEDIKKLEALTRNNPWMVLLMMMTPPRTSVYIKDRVCLVESKGIGYEFMKYYNLHLDEGYLYTASLINPDEAVSATFTPSDGLEPYTFNTDGSAKKMFTVAGYDCIATTYIPEPIIQEEGSVLSMNPLRPFKLVVYTNRDLPREINYAYPHHVPEDHAIMRMDIYIHDHDQPTLVYEVISIERTTIGLERLDIKKTTPMYQVSDPEYGNKSIGIIMDILTSFGKSIKNTSVL